MDLIFGECVQLKKEFEELLKILKDLNVFNFCLKYTFNCKDYFKEKCKNCDLYLKIKDILLNCKNAVIVNYAKIFLSDYCKISEVSKEFFKIDLSFNFDFSFDEKESNSENLTEKNCIKYQYNFKDRKRNFYL